MGLRHHLRELRRARQQARRQQRALLTLEVAGLVAVTLHSATHALTIAVPSATGAQLVGELTELLHARRRHLKVEIRQLRTVSSSARPPNPGPIPPAPPES